MSDCSGYGFGVTFKLCLDGELGNGNYPNLIISAENTFHDNFDNNQSITISGWTGEKITHNLSSILSGNGFKTANCSNINAYLTITPDFGSNTGTLLLRWTFNGCAAANYPADDPLVFDNCGETAGQHVISEMSTYTLDESACIII